MTMPSKIKIFMLEDDVNFGSVLKLYLEMHDFDVTWVDDGMKAVSSFREGCYDICILDVMLPHVDGFTVARDIRRINSAMPMIFLTAKTLKEDMLEGYRIGADDYIKKPFDSEVLIYKIKAILRRNNGRGLAAGGQDRYTIGKFSFDYNRRIISDHTCTTSVKISPKEAELLRLLCLYRNSILPREHALRSIWGDDNYFTTRSMDVFIAKLRKYLKDDPSIEIMTVHGVGFKLTGDVGQ
jgi:two-component system OmpR family response regulator